MREMARAGQPLTKGVAKKDLAFALKELKQTAQRNKAFSESSQWVREYVCLACSRNNCSYLTFWKAHFLDEQKAKLLDRDQ